MNDQTLGTLSGCCDGDGDNDKTKHHRAKGGQSHRNLSRRLAPSRLQPSRHRPATFPSQDENGLRLSFIYTFEDVFALLTLPLRFEAHE